MATYVAQPCEGACGLVRLLTVRQVSGQNAFILIRDFSAAAFRGLSTEAAECQGCPIFSCCAVGVLLLFQHPLLIVSWWADISGQ